MADRFDEMARELVAQQKEVPRHNARASCIACGFVWDGIRSCRCNGYDLDAGEKRHAINHEVQIVAAALRRVAAKENEACEKAVAFRIRCKADSDCDDDCACSPLTDAREAIAARRKEIGK